MRNIPYNKAIWSLSLIILICLVFSRESYSQGDKQRVYFSCQHYSSPEGNKLIATAKARIGENRRIIPVSGLEISFYYLSDTAEQILGTAITNDEGMATLPIEGSVKTIPDEDGEISFNARFVGNDQLRKATAKVAIEPVKMELSFILIDSVKSVSVKAYKDGAEEMEWLDEDVEVIFYVPGSFSLLEIGERTFSDGEASVPFPVTLPGDSLGNLKILAKIESNEEFGVVEVSGIKDWGAPRVYDLPEKRRGLGDTDAPLWMVYTLIVLLSAVWFHYMYVFFVIFLIKRKGEVS